MVRKQSRLRVLPAILAGFMCAFLLLSPTVALADTDGTELLVTDQPDKLVIQLGPAWAGVEFELKTDVGVYPQPIVVSPEGLLTMELGGSKTYTLSAMRSTVPVPVPENDTEESSMDVPASDPSGDGVVSGEDQQPQQKEEAEQPTGSETEEAAQPDGDESGSLIKGIPNMHLFLFAGGLIASIAGLVVMWILKKRKNSQYDDDDDYYEDE